MAKNIARVFVNNIQVGTLPTAQYQQIVKDTRRDPRLIALQGLNVAGMSLRYVLTTLRLVPWIWFAAFALFALTNPTQLAQLLTELRALTPQQAALEIRNLLVSSMLFSFVFVAIGTMAAELWNAAIPATSLGATPKTAAPYGFVNHFDQAVKARVREQLQIAEPGEIDIVVFGAARQFARKRLRAVN